MINTNSPIPQPDLELMKQLEELVRKRLEQDGCFRGRSRQIQIENHDGDLVLHGRLPSFYLKQLLQATLAGVDGVKSIDNQVDVLWPEDEA